MKNKKSAIRFSLQHIDTKQFAVFGEGPLNAVEIQENIEFAFGVNEEQCIVGCLFRYTLFDSDQPFITIEVVCDFQVEKESWDQMLELKKAELVLPKGFAQHIANITVGTARGILHNKTENTIFNKYPIALINLQKIFSKDVVITLE